MNFSLADMNATEEFLDNYIKYLYEYEIIGTIVSSFVLIICCIGVPLNGIVIWLLVFQIKRNPFTVLILNLAIADFGFLVFMIISFIHICITLFQPGILYDTFLCLLHVTYINGLFLLTTISIDRCVAVLFPIWHRCSRPKYLSPAVCVFLWIISFLLFGILDNMKYWFLHNVIENFEMAVTAVFCLPLITTSTMILFIKICLKPKQIKRGRLLVMILITLLCFLILTLPLVIYVFVTVLLKKNWFYDYALDLYLALSGSLNSSVNPVIYFLAGRKKRARTRESIVVIFRRVFKEDEAPEIR